MLRDQFTAALKEAMKTKDEIRVATLRLILAALKDRDIARRGAGETGGIEEDEILQMLSKMVRQRRDSARVYEEGGRADLAERELEEIAIIEGFLPRQLSESEIRDAANRVIKEVDAKGLKDMGRVMAALRERHAGALDPGKASVIVKSLLA